MDELNVNEVFYYDETSPSCLRWNINIPYKGLYKGSPTTFKRAMGDVAGSFHKGNNRYKVKYKQKAYMVHRIIYELHFGPLEKGKVIDHIDGNSSNNLISNLRLVTQKVNSRNSKISSNNKTGIMGVSHTKQKDSVYEKTYEYYCAHWTVDGKQFNMYYSVAKYGEEEAFRLACEYRAKMIEELNKHGAGYAEGHGRHNQILTDSHAT